MHVDHRRALEAHEVLGPEDVIEPGVHDESRTGLHDRIRHRGLSGRARSELADGERTVRHARSRCTIERGDARTIRRNIDHARVERAGRARVEDRLQIRAPTRHEDRHGERHAKSTRLPPE